VFNVRCATVSDSKVIGDLLVRSARFAYAEIASPEYLASLDPELKAREYEQILSVQREGHHAVFVAEENDVPLGFAEIELTEAEATYRVGELRRMYFVPESLGRGLGPVLHGAVIAELARWGCSEAMLTYVRGNHRAKSFYLKSGWTETGEVRPFDDHGRELFDIVMRRPVP
jgi:GNAT superfamily N-acetyltransferase